MLEEHLFKQKPTQQTYIGPGLLTLPKRIVEKMLNWEYINFNELIPFCDPNTDDEQPSSLVPEQ